jgi:hypothetical protein
MMRLSEWIAMGPGVLPRRTRIPERCEAQVVDAYLKMAEHARYRPQAPSDGFGHITMPLAELDIDEEAREYAQAFWDSESESWWFIGCANFTQRTAMVYFIEAARACCSSDPDLARDLATLAIAELKDQKTQKAW